MSIDAIFKFLSESILEKKDNSVSEVFKFYLPEISKEKSFKILFNNIDEILSFTSIDNKAQIPYFRSF